MRTHCALVLCTLTVACGASRPAGGADAAPDRSAVVIRGADMTGNLLDALSTRMPNMRVRREGTRCPGIVFRGQRSSVQQGNPSVYVDGTLMADTCILLLIAASDVDYVEVFPSGIASGTGSQRNPFGAILVHRIRHE
jgi:hypothetical protein